VRWSQNSRCRCAGKDRRQAQAEPRGLAQRAGLGAQKQPAGDTTDGEAGGGGVRSSASFQGNSWVKALHPTPQHARLHPRLGVKKIFQTGFHASADPKALLSKCEESLPSSKTVSLCLVEEVVVCLQLGCVAGLVCMPEFMAPGLPWEWPGHPGMAVRRCPSQRECVGASICVTSELEERTAAGVRVLRTGNCQ